MKKAATWGALISFGIAIISFVIIGIKLLDGNCEFTVEAYIGAAGFFIMIICGLKERLAISALTVEKQSWIMESIALIVERRLKSKKL